MPMPCQPVAWAVGELVAAEDKVSDCAERSWESNTYAYGEEIIHILL